MGQNLLTTDRALLICLSLATIIIIPSSCATLPRNSEAARIPASPASAANKDAPRVNINTATASELERLPGVGRVLAERIIFYRKEYGPFRRAEHLLMVRGMSDRKFRVIRPLVTTH